MRNLKRLVAIVLLVGCLRAYGKDACGGTATVVQHKYTTSCVGNGSNTTCTITPKSASGAGHLGAIVAWFSGTTDSPSNGITSVSGNSHGTTGWMACPSHSCFASVGTVATGCLAGYCSQDIYYNPAMTGGDTSFTVTLGAPPPTFFQVWYAEWSLPGSGGAVYDTSAGGGDTTACTSCAGQALTLNDTQDIVIQTENSSQECTAIVPSSYDDPVDITNDVQYGGIAAAAIDVTAQPKTPTYTCTSGTVPVSALALAECRAAVPGTITPNPPVDLADTVTTPAEGWPNDMKVNLTWQPGAAQAGVAITDYEVYLCDTAACATIHLWDKVDATRYTMSCPVAYSGSGSCYYMIRAKVEVNGTPEVTGDSNIISVPVP